MSFQDRFNNARETFKVESFSKESSLNEDTIKESSLNEKRNYLEQEEHLRELGYKLKLVTPTRFGVQIDFSKKYNVRDIRRDLKGFNFEMDGDQVFIKR